MPINNTEQDKQIQEIIESQWENGTKWTRLKLMSPIHTLKMAGLITIWTKPKLWLTVLQCLANDIHISYLILVKNFK